jgi:PPOX class probable F420-dependent enzyme
VSDVAALAAAQYVSLVSYRRDGTPVPTPVWVVGYGSGVAVWSARDTFKVKRIQRNPDVTVAPCRFRGEVTGPAVAGRATIMSDADSARVRSLIRRKYGLTGRLTVLGSILRRGRTGSVGIAIEPVPE